MAADDRSPASAGVLAAAAYMDDTTWEVDVDDDVGQLKPGQLEGPAATRRVEPFSQRIMLILQAAARAIEVEHNTMLEEREPASHVGQIDHQASTCKSTVGNLRSLMSLAPPALPSAFQQGTHSTLASSRGSIEVEPLDDDLIGNTRTPPLPDGGSGEVVVVQKFASTVGMLPSDASGRARHKVYRLLPEWMNLVEEDHNVDDDAITAQMTYYESLTVPSASPKHLHSGASIMRRSRQGGGFSFIMHPSNTFRIFWDSLACLCLFYDVYVIPLSVFELPQDGIIMYLSLVTLIYWMLDIPLSFIVGFVRPDGEIELRAQRIVPRYLKGWFIPDVGIVCVSAFTFIERLLGNPDSGSDSAGILRLGKVFRVVRLLRVMRLVRLRKLKTASEKLQAFIGMESTAIIMSICKNLMLISILTHVIAAGWFWVGLNNEDVGWLSLYKSSNWLDNYVLSFQWSLANFTPGSSGIQPQTTQEYAFHVVVLCFAMVVFSVFVSSTTSLITRLMTLQSSQTQQLWKLKGFLFQHRFPVDFRERVLKYVQSAMGSRHDTIKWQDVELLKVLSKPLREEIQSTLHSATLKVSPIVKQLALTNPPLMRKLSTDAVSEVSYSGSDEIFSLGENIDKMFFVLSGCLRYSKVFKKDVRHEIVRPHSYVCEASLWTKWHSQGAMAADADCTILLELDASSFRRTVIRHHHTMTSFVREYAEAFVDDLNHLASSNAGGLSDLQNMVLAEGRVERVLMQQVERLSVDSSAYPQGRSRSSRKDLWR